MRKELLFLGAMAAVIFVSGCVSDTGRFVNCVPGSGNVVSRDFDLDEFSSISFGGAGYIFVTQSENQSMRIEADDNVIDLLLLDVINGRLVIDSNNCFTNIRPIKIWASMKDVNGITVSGSAEIVSENEINTDSFDLRVSGSSSSDMNINSEEISTTISGSGNVNYRGSTKSHDIHISGSGNVKALDLSTEETKITISGFGNIEVDASEDLDVTISGSGNVLHSGNASVTQTISGFGKITRA